MVYVKTQTVTSPPREGELAGTSGERQTQVARKTKRDRQTEKQSE